MKPPAMKRLENELWAMLPCGSPATISVDVIDGIRVATWIFDEQDQEKGSFWAPISFELSDADAEDLPRFEHECWVAITEIMAQRQKALDA